MSPVPINNKEDPNKGEETQDVSAMEAPQFIVPGTSSDSDEEYEDEPGNQGYQLLPQEPGNESVEPDCPVEPPEDMFDSVVVSSLEAQDYINAGGTSGLFDVPGGDDEVQEQRELWGATEVKAHEPMDPAQADQIRAAMAGFTLPAPDWAKTIPEDEWKARLINRVQNTQQQSSSQDTNANR